MGFRKLFSALAVGVVMVATLLLPSPAQAAAPDSPAVPYSNPW